MTKRPNQQVFNHEPFYKVDLLNNLVAPQGLLYCICVSDI